MLFILDRMCGRDLILPLVCIMGLACGTLVTGALATARGTHFRVRIFWYSMIAFLLTTALLIGRMSHWTFSLVLLVPMILFLFLFEAGKRNR